MGGESAIGWAVATPRSEAIRWPEVIQWPAAIPCAPTIPRAVAIPWVVANPRSDGRKRPPIGRGDPMCCGDVMGCGDPMGDGDPTCGSDPTGSGDPMSGGDAIGGGDFIGFGGFRSTALGPVRFRFAARSSPLVTRVRTVDFFVGALTRLRGSVPGAICTCARLVVIDDVFSFVCSLSCLFWCFSVFVFV